MKLLADFRECIVVFPNKIQLIRFEMLDPATGRRFNVIVDESELVEVWHAHTNLFRNYEPPLVDLDKYPTLTCIASVLLRVNYPNLESKITIPNNSTLLDKLRDLHMSMGDERTRQQLAAPLRPDVLIKVGIKDEPNRVEFWAHKFILALESDYFRLAFNSDMLEAQLGIVEIEVGSLLLFF
jgi:hypothetical protein